MFWFMVAEQQRWELEQWRRAVLAHFTEDPQKLVARIDEVLDSLSGEGSKAEVRRSGATLQQLAMAVPKGMLRWLPAGSIQADIERNLQKQAEMDAAIATGDPEQIRAVIRQQKRS